MLTQIPGCRYKEVMNDTLKAIHERRSIRSYSPQKIEEDSLKAILDAGINAPNAMNMQQWHFTVIRDSALLDRMVSTIRENMPLTGIPFLMEKAQDPEYHTFYHAPTVVMISGDSSSKHIGIDSGAAAENMAIAAQSLGIGSCIIASSDLLFLGDTVESYRKELHIPENYNHILCVALGYPAGDIPEAKERKKDVIDYIG